MILRKASALLPGDRVKLRAESTFTIHTVAPDQSDHLRCVLSLEDYSFTQTLLVDDLVEVIPD